MSQHDLSIANQGFPAFRSDLNDALQALGSMQSGTSVPATTYANMLWYDTTNNIVKMRNEDNDAWISLITLDQTGDLISQIGSVALSNIALLTGNQTIAGVKTFSSSPVLPNASIPQAALAANVAGNGPAFAAYVTSNQSFSSSTSTRVAFGTEIFDTASCFNNTNATVGGIPAYSFMPNVAGYYQVNVTVDVSGSPSISRSQGNIFKNGAAFLNYSDFANTAVFTTTGSALIYLNGTTDYISVNQYVTSSAPLVSGGQPYSLFSASLVRAA